MDKTDTQCSKPRPVPLPSLSSLLFLTIFIHLRLNPSQVLGGSGRVGDFDLFVDEDGMAYHVRTGIVIEKLDVDYMGGRGEIFFDQHRC